MELRQQYGTRVPSYEETQNKKKELKRLLQIEA